MSQVHYMMVLPHTLVNMYEILLLQEHMVTYVNIINCIYHALR